VEFDVIYDDGTRTRVTEGILLGVENEKIVFHNGTNRANVLFAALESLIEVIGYLGLGKKCEEYMNSKPAAETPDGEGGTDHGRV
jgi:hypothetical protein